MSDPRPPLISMSAEQLVEYLDNSHRPCCIGQSETLEMAHRRAGRRELIDQLIARMKLEKEKYGSTTQIQV